MSKFDEKRYVRLRKKLLKEKQTLVYERTETNNKIRKVDKDMKNWDKALLNT